MVSAEDQDFYSIDALAERLYEDGRKFVSGRPAWRDLNPKDPYEMGMREMAYSLAREQRRVEAGVGE